MTSHWDRPGTPRALHAWISDVLDVRISRAALINGHHAPFDYLLHTFFEGNPPPDPAEAPDPSRNGALARRTPVAPPTPHPADLVVWANRGGGKTFLGALATVLDLLFKPGIEVRILAGSLEQARHMFAHLRRFFSIPALADTLKGRATERRIVLASHSTVEILAQSEPSVRGTRVQKLRCDEVDLFDPAIWEAAQLTTRSTSCDGLHVRGSVECLSTMHRPHGLMFRLVKDCTAGTRRLLKWGLVDSLTLCGPEHACTSARGDCPLLPECAGRAKRPIAPPAPHHSDRCPPDRPDDNPSHGHITIQDAITMKSRVSLAAWESEMLCLRPSRGHAVLPEFDPALHVVDDSPREHVTWLAGMDFGFRAPTVILWGALDTSGTLWITDEHCHTQMLLEEHIRAIRSAPEQRGIPLPAWLAADPAGHQRHEQTGISNIDALRKAGLVVQTRNMGLGEGLMLLRARLKPAAGAPRLLIHRRCERLIESLERYHYPEDDPESMTPVKDGHDHAVDALRYLVQCLDRPHRTTTASYRD